jgi:cytochrome c peroxidase
MPQPSSEQMTTRARETVFNGVPSVHLSCSTLTEPGWNMHTAGEIGVDDFQASRAPDDRYRTAPLKGLWTHTKGGFYHDGRFASLMDVVNHYDSFKALHLTDQEKRDLVEYLKSL